MKIAIVYSSVHHGNTKKVLEAVKQEIDVDLDKIYRFRENYENK
ncbi:hypothetical protein LZ906_015595 [Paraclostridium ghonii]|nr:hypothetical protein [Paeniclostridium ghonii]